MQTFCVVLRQQHSFSAIHPRTKRYFLRAKTAVQAMLITSEDPDWCVIGVEPADVSFSKSHRDRLNRPKIDIATLLEVSPARHHGAIGGQA